MNAAATARRWCILRSASILRLLPFAVAAAVIWFAAACTENNERVEVQPSASATVVQAALASPTTSPTSAPNPTSTAMPTTTNTPLPTPTTAPTATAEPTATSTPLPTPTPEPTETPEPAGPRLTIAGATFLVEIADTPELRSKGLGERDSLDERTGMLFIFQSGQTSSFWMKGMRFPLDFVWIGEDCTVVDLTENVQHSPPDTPSSELEIIESASPAAYTFEINAGEVSRFSIEVGDDVRFNGIESEFAMCCEMGVCNGK